MSVSQRVNNLASGNDLLQILGEYLRNPKLIDDLNAEVIKLTTLSDEEEARLHEAKTLMQQRDELKAETERQAKALADDLAAHDRRIMQDKKNADEYVAAKNAEVALAHKKLDEREAALAELAARLDQRENTLKEKAAKVTGLFS